MSYIPTISYVLDALGVTGIVVGGYVASKSVYSKENGAAATELIANLQKLRETDKAEFMRRIKALENRHAEDERLHNENSKAIADLQGQLKTYKELPLVTLADGIKEVAASNKEILAQLRETATIAAEDRDVLTNQNLHIKTEVRKEMDKK